jgi:uncharacterized LabA/DUF88 family protein
MTKNAVRRLAVLIDAENTSSKIAKDLFEEIARIGEASVRRIYGDFTSPHLKNWTALLSTHAILPQQQFAYVTGKNAADIALVIDAMDLMHSGRFDGFCLVSSDSDFTRLAARLREEGLEVYGFGAQKTPQSFREACFRFIYTENLGARAAAAEEASPAKHPPSKATPLLKKALEQAEGDDGWAALSAVGSHLRNLASDFDERTYGCAKLSDLVAATGAFEVKTPEGAAMRIRLRQSTAAAPKTAKTKSQAKPGAT